MANLSDGNSREFSDLRQRVIGALELGVESRSVEFKTGRKWRLLKTTIIKCILAMSNTKNGGIIIIGRSEELTIDDGISQEDLATFNYDKIRDAIGSFAFTMPDLDIVEIPLDDKRYVVFEVREFIEIPTICKKSDESTKLQIGDIYVRRDSGRARSDRPDALEISALLELAVDKRMSKFKESARRRGYNRGHDDSERFEAEARGF